MYILGINCSMHDSAACILRDGELLFAVAEERLTRQKKDTRFPVSAIQASLDFAGIGPEQVDHVAISWPKPSTTFLHDVKCLLSGKIASSKEHWWRLFARNTKAMYRGGGRRDYQRYFGRPRGNIHLLGHHYSHAVSAYAMSGFDDASVIVIDGRGARNATTLWQGQGETLELLDCYQYPDSIGIFYGEMTEQLGFTRFSDEWKVMGLASYGNARFDMNPVIQSTGSRYHVEARKLYGRDRKDHAELEALFGPRRKDSDPLDDVHRDLAASTQKACEEAMHLLLRACSKRTGSRNLCLAGGVALNSKANGELLRSPLVDDIFIQPAAGDDGTCIGAALGVYPKLGLPLPRVQQIHSSWGGSFSDEEIQKTVATCKLPHKIVDEPSRVAAELLADGKLLGWFQGRMEFGPRALGCRSILADPRDEANRDRVNAAVKFREGWRPFAPAVLEERGAEFFEDFKPSPFMILTFWTRPEQAAKIPAVVHVDGSSRVQSVTREQNPPYYDMIEHFGQLTGIPVVLNTSFNLKDEPIVCSPRDAIRTFYTSGLDYLVIGNVLVGKSDFEGSQQSATADVSHAIDTV